MQYYFLILPCMCACVCVCGWVCGTLHLRPRVSWPYLGIYYLWKRAQKCISVHHLHFSCSTECVCVLSLWIASCGCLFFSLRLQLSSVCDVPSMFFFFFAVQEKVAVQFLPQKRASIPESLILPNVTCRYGRYYSISFVRGLVRSNFSFCFSCFGGAVAVIQVVNKVVHEFYVRITI